MTKDEMMKLSKKGLDAKLPAIECFPNTFKDYKIVMEVPEYTSVCPKTGLPDFGVLTITYVPNKWVIELKSLKYYIHAYRNLGIAYENAVNRILKDLSAACKPKWMMIRGEFTPRGGIQSTVEAQVGKKPKDVED